MPGRAVPPSAGGPLFSFDRAPGTTFAQGQIKELQSRLPDQGVKAGQSRLTFCVGLA